jgi:hypothetical protein
MPLKPKVRALAILASLLFVLAAAGAIFEQIGRRHDRSHYPQIGRSVDIGGRSLNLYCSGQGGPTVVFDTFSHMAGYVWTKAQPEVARYTRACWYDRAGYGWSEPGGAPLFDSEAADLHRLLAGAGERPPYLLVGPGEAALRAVVYRSLYPREVAGILMLNPIAVDEDKRAVPDAAMGPWARTFGSFGTRVRSVACHAAPVLSGIGFFRLIAGRPRRTPASDLTPQEHEELDFLSDNPTTASHPDVCVRVQNMEQARRAGSLQDVPLMVLASRPHDGRGTPDWIERRVRLAALSSRGRLVWTEGNAEPAAIADIVGQMVATAEQLQSR